MSSSELSELFKTFMAAPVNSDGDEEALNNLCFHLALKNSNAELRSKLADLAMLVKRVR